MGLLPKNTAFWSVVSNGSM